jgi:polar amino acid transport system substrate-binding protein
MILNKTEFFTGIVLKYNVNKESLSRTRFGIKSQKSDVKSIKAYHASIHSSGHADTAVRAGFIGAGSFAQNILLPNLKKILSSAGGELIGVATARSTTSKYTADKFGFKYATCNAGEIINDPNINTVFIATRHNTHAEYVIKALESGKNVFVEKPLAMNEEQLTKIYETYHASMQSSIHPLNLLVGYNRRFSSLIKKLKEELSPVLPVAVNYRINAGALPVEHWINDPETGGGRIIGEVCHFIDLCMFITASPLISVQAESLDSTNNLTDTVIINLKFANGSVASISYFSNGSKKLEKEYLEVFQGGRVFIVNDFKEMKIIGEKETRIKLRKQDKGHSEEIRSFIHLSRRSEVKPDAFIQSFSPIPFEELYMTGLATFKVIESIRKREVIKFE